MRDHDGDLDRFCDNEPELSGKAKKVNWRVGADGATGGHVSAKEVVGKAAKSPFLLNWGDTVGVLMHIEQSPEDSGDDGEAASCICTMHFSVNGKFLKTRNVFPLSASATVFPAVSVNSASTRLVCRFSEHDTLHHADVQQLQEVTRQSGSSSQLQLHPHFFGQRIECLDGTALAV
jgi:hypothetical protein